MHPQLQRCYDQAIKGAWQHPFFLIPLGHCEWHEAIPEITKTMAIASVVKQGKPEINLFINTEWVSHITDEEIFGVLAHEILHSMLRHEERSGGKKRELWGQAADMAINSQLKQAGIKLPVSGLFPPPGHEDSPAEELYALLETEEIPQSKKYNPDMVTQGCMPQKGSNGQEPGSENSGQEGSGNGQGEGEQQGQEQGDGNGNGGSESNGEGSGEGGDSDRAWGEMIAQCQSYSRGTGTAKVMAKLFKAKPIKTQWNRLLRQVANRAQAKGGRDTQSFQRVNRRTSGDIIFPGWQSTSPAIAIMMDTSGSVSDEMLESAINSVMEIKKSTNVRIFLALHDGECYWSGWVTPEITVKALSSHITARGGTDPDEAFEAVRNARGRFDACVYLTDGEVGRYPDKPLNVKRMIVGLLDSGHKSYRAQVPSTWQEVLVEIK